MKELNDNDVLSAYMCGWHDEYEINNGIKNAGVYKNELLMNAYNMGRSHFRSKSKSFDNLTNEEILKIIKNES